MIGINFNNQLFDPGEIRVTQGITALDLNISDLEEMINKHTNGIFGQLDREDIDQNMEHIGSKFGMIMSVYVYYGTKIYVITDSPGKVTTILLPEEY